MDLGGTHPINQFSSAILLLTCKTVCDLTALYFYMPYHQLPATRLGVTNFFKYS